MSDAPNPEDMKKSIALLEAAEAGDAEAVTRLLEAGASGWRYRSEFPPTRMLKPMIDKSAVNRAVMFSMHDDVLRQNVPLYVAAWSGHENVVDIFLQRKDYDQDTLNTALYGAISAQSLPLVDKLLAAGADPLGGNGIILRNNMDGPAELIDALIAAADKGQALAVILSKERKDVALRLLDKEKNIDLHPAFSAICHALNARENIWNRQDNGYYLDMLHILMGYAAGRGDDVGGLLAYGMKRAAQEWATPVIDAIIQDPLFEGEVPHRQALLNLALQAVTTLVGATQEIAQYDYEGTARRLVEKGAAPQPLLFDAVEMGHVKFAHLALKHGADPRMQAMLKADSLLWTGSNLSSLTVRDVLALGVIGLSNDELDFLAGSKGARYVTGLTPEFLRFASVTTRHSGLALALMCGEGAAALDSLLAAEQPLCADDLLMADRDGFRVLDHVLRDTGLTEKILSAAHWHFRAGEYCRVWEALPEKTREKFAGQHQETLNHLQSMETQRDLRAKATAQKDRFKLK